jgi:hypothetical protein
MMNAAECIDTSLERPWEYRQWMEEAGIVNVKEYVYRFPINAWPKDPKLKDLGLWEMANMLEGIEGFSLVFFTEVLGWSRKELEVLLANVWKDVTNRKIHACWQLVAVVGQKPMQ